MGTAGGNVDWYSHFGGHFGDAWQNFVYWPSDPTIPFLRIYPKKKKTLVIVHIRVTIWFMTVYETINLGGAKTVCLAHYLHP